MEREQAYLTSESEFIPEVLFGNVGDQIITGNNHYSYCRFFLNSFAVVIGVVGIMFLTAGLIILPFYNVKYNQSPHFAYHLTFLQTGGGMLAIASIITLTTFSCKKLKTKKKKLCSYKSNYEINHQINYLVPLDTVITAYPVQIEIVSDSYDLYN
ncbi:hypothetical protein TrispH2_002727 [Trichoplax sp. H2]|nr:hypothetical protein TrispH2_002727 [Trichoplax sp. H2]|eukprot:RDD45653.1 hypothetical protein TrispH2_002727 [Trichoplax sp. H2]